MINVKKRISALILFIFSLSFFVLILSSCDSEKGRAKYDLTIWPISESDIISFQQAYGDSFNEVAKAIADETYYELKAKEHINNFYYFEDGEVIFKIGGEDNQPFRNSFDGLLSYLIGKNKDYPNDEGIAKQNWQKIDWNNLGTIIQKDVAIAIGSVTMQNADQTINQNYTMVLKRHTNGKLKLVAHKISAPCG